MTDPKNEQTVTTDHHNAVVDYLIYLLAVSRSAASDKAPTAPPDFTVKVRSNGAASVLDHRGKVVVELCRGGGVLTVAQYAAMAGFTPDRVKGPTPRPPLAAKWVPVCPVCSKRMAPRKRRSSNVSCGTCSPTFDQRFLLRWEPVGASAAAAAGQEPE